MSESKDVKTGKSRSWLPAIIVLVSLVLSVIFVQFNQISYGGYKGLLMASLVMNLVKKTMNLKEELVCQAIKGGIVQSSQLVL